MDKEIAKYLAEILNGLYDVSPNERNILKSKIIVESLKNDKEK